MRGARVSLAVMMAVCAGAAAQVRGPLPAGRLSPGPLAVRGEETLAVTDEGLVVRGPAKDPLRSFAARFGLRGAVGEIRAAGVAEEARWRAEDEAARMAGDKRLRFGVARDALGGAANGAWEDVIGADGKPLGRVWSLDVVVTGAVAVRAHLRGLDLPPGASMVAYSPDEPERVFGPIGGRGWRESGQMWTPTTRGERQRIEVFVPAGAGGAGGAGGLGGLRVDRLLHVYRDPVAETLRGPGCPDVACNSTWTTTAKAVGGIGYVGDNAMFCSGQMIATVANDLTPYWLTANHCLSTDADAADAEVFWMYQAAVCGGSVPGLTSVPRSQGCTLISTGTISDYTLLIVDGAIPATRGWAGWTSTQPVNGVASACIHQPGGGPKKISLGSMAGTTNNPCSPSGHVRVNWTAGGTEGGSSGSGIFRSDTQQLYGHLHCGPSSCAVSGSYDGYGSFASDYANPAVQTALAAGSEDALEPNDSCAAARLMSPGTYSSLVVKSGDEDWYRVTLQAGQSVTVTAAFVHAYGDIDLAVHGSCAGAAVAVSDTTDDSEALQATNPGSGPMDAYFRVYLYNGGNYPDTRNRYNLSIQLTAAPPAGNNSCATPLTIQPGATAFNTTTATTDGPSETLCNNFGTSQLGQDLWFRWTAGACGGTVTLSLCGSGFDTRLAVYAGSGCPAGPDTAIACNDDSCGVQSELTFVAVGGQAYLIRVGGYGAASGAGTLTLTAPTLSNNACAAAIQLPGPGTYGIDTCGATTDGPDDGAACVSAASSQVYNDVWYRYTPPSLCAGLQRVNLCGSSIDTRVSVYSAATGCPATAGRAIACNDDSCGAQSQVVFNAVAGQAYLLRMGSYLSNGWGPVSFQVGPAADWDANARVEPSDVALFVSDWFIAIQSGTRRADINMDGAVTPADVAQFVQAWVGAVSGGC